MGVIDESTSYRGIVDIKYDRGDAYGGDTYVCRRAFVFATKPTQLEIDRAMDKAVFDYLLEARDFMAPKALIVGFQLERIYIVKHIPDET